MLDNIKADTKWWHESYERYAAYTYNNTGTKLSYRCMAFMKSEKFKSHNNLVLVTDHRLFLWYPTYI